MQTIITSALLGLFIWSAHSPAIEPAPEIAEAAETAPAKELTVRMTAYNAVPEQTDDTPTVTASGAYTHSDVVAARSVDLANELPYGTVIEIVADSASASNSCGIGVVDHLLGYRVIADSMHPRKRNQIDVLFDENETVRLSGKEINPARALGVCSGVTIRVVGKVDIAKMPTTQAALAEAVGVASLAMNR